MKRHDAYDLGYRDGSIWASKGNDPTEQKEGIGAVASAHRARKHITEALCKPAHFRSYEHGFADGACDESEARKGR